MTQTRSFKPLTALPDSRHSFSTQRLPTYPAHDLETMVVDRLKQLLPDRRVPGLGRPDRRQRCRASARNHDGSLLAEQLHGSGKRADLVEKLIADVRMHLAIKLRPRAAAGVASNCECPCLLLPADIILTERVAWLSPDGPAIRLHATANPRSRHRGLAARREPLGSIERALTNAEHQRRMLFGAADLGTLTAQGRCRHVGRDGRPKGQRAPD